MINLREGGVIGRTSVRCRLNQSIIKQLNQLQSKLAELRVSSVNLVILRVRLGEITEMLQCNIAYLAEIWIDRVINIRKVSDRIIFY